MKFLLFLPILLIAVRPAYAEHNDADALSICRVRFDEPDFVEPCRVVLEADREERRRRNEEGRRHDLTTVKRAIEALDQK